MVLDESRERRSRMNYDDNLPAGAKRLLEEIERESEEEEIYSEYKKIEDMSIELNYVNYLPDHLAEKIQDAICDSVKWFEDKYDFKE